MEIEIVAWLADGLDVADFEGGGVSDGGDGVVG